MFMAMSYSEYDLNRVNKWVSLFTKEKNLSKNIFYIMSYLLPKDCVLASWVGFEC